MFENERSVNEFMVQYLAKLVDDLAEEDLDRVLAEGVNPPHWILGHLAVNTDYALRMLGKRFQCPIEWHRSYARGSRSISRPEMIPGKDHLVKLISEGFATVRELSCNADAVAMNKPHVVPFLQGTPIKTVGDVLTHLMTTHLSTHVGQLSFWRRMAGRSRVEPGDETT